MNYNEEQLEAINSAASHVVVVAPPGSGKTASMIGAIQKFLKDNPKANIIAITFTRNAAAELSHKLYDTGDNVQVSTIHSWSLKELNKLGVKYKFKVSLLEETKIRDRLAGLSRELGYYTLNQNSLFLYVNGNYNLDLTQSVKNKFKRILNAYIAWKRANDLYDFTDLPLYLYNMLSRYNEEIITVDGLFVDEFQDVDEVQAQIFEKVIAKKYFYIGDPDQSIYVFRGCTPENLNQLTGFTKYKLIRNYRSYQAILDYSTQIQEKDTYDLLSIQKLKPSWVYCVRQEEYGEVYSGNEYEECFDLVHNKEVDLYETFLVFLLKKPFILCRSNKEVKKIKELGYEWVSTIHQAKGLEYSNVVVSNMTLDNMEERNIGYVACTRAQNGLFIIDFNMLYRLLFSMIRDYNEQIKGGVLF